MPKKPKTYPNFQTYWHYAKYLTREHRQKFFLTLPDEEQKRIISSYWNAGWNDLFAHEVIAELYNFIKDKHKVDLLDARLKALKGKSVFLPTAAWNEAAFLINKLVRAVWDADKKAKKQGYIFDETETHLTPENVNYLFGGVRPVVCKANSNVILLVRNDSEAED